MPNALHDAGGDHLCVPAKNKQKKLPKTIKNVIIIKTADS